MDYFPKDVGPIEVILIILDSWAMKDGPKNENKRYFKNDWPISPSNYRLAIQFVNVQQIMSVEEWFTVGSSAGSKLPG